MAKNKKSLLSKQNDLYYENCPGCKVEKRKAENPNLPWLHFFFIWIITLSSCMLILYFLLFLHFILILGFLFILFGYLEFDVFLSFLKGYDHDFGWKEIYDLRSLNFVSFHL